MAAPCQHEVMEGKPGYWQKFFEYRKPVASNHKVGTTTAVPTKDWLDDIFKDHATQLVEDFSARGVPLAAIECSIECSFGHPIECSIRFFIEWSIRQLCLLLLDTCPHAHVCTRLHTCLTECLCA